MRWLRTWPRASMTTKRLGSLAIINIHYNKNIDYKEVSKLDLVINIASETLTSLYVIAFVTCIAIMLSKKMHFFKSNIYNLKQNKQYSNTSWNIVMVKWFCSWALCFNNFTSKDCKGRPLKYYRSPRGIKVIYVPLTGVLGKEKVLMICLIFQYLQTNYGRSRKNMKPQKMCWKNIKLHHKNYILDSYKNAKRI